MSASLRVIALLAAMAAIALPAAAHRLNVFAWIDGEEVVVEGKFASGVVPAVGTVRVYDGADVLLVTVEIGRDGAVRIPLGGLASESGLRIEMDVGDGHEDYWILTPGDIESQRATAPQG